LQEQAARLSQTVSVFKLGAMHSGPVAAAPTVASRRPTVSKAAAPLRKATVDITPRKPVLAKSAPQSEVARLPAVAKPDSDDWEQF
jgi:hypothetical protein